MNLPTVLRLPAVCHAVGASRASVWRWVKNDPSFPKPFSLGKNSTGWDAAELSAWIESRKAARQTTQ